MNTMARTEFDRAINASDLQEWIMEVFPDWCEGDIRLIYDHIDDMPTVTINDLAEEIKVTNCNHNAEVGKMDLIYRQDVTDALDRRFAEHIKQFDYDSYENADEKTQLVCDGIIDAIDVVLGLPSAQPEIIHCRECKHWREGDAYSYCDKLFSMGVLDVYDYMASEDDFCSNAERRTDAETEV